MGGYEIMRDNLYCQTMQMSGVVTHNDSNTTRKG